MNVNVTGPFIYFTIPIFGGIPITQTTGANVIVLCAVGKPTCQTNKSRGEEAIFGYQSNSKRTEPNNLDFI